MITATKQLAIVTGWRAPSADEASAPAIVTSASDATQPITSRAVRRPASSSETLSWWVRWRPLATLGATAAWTAPNSSVAAAVSHGC
jgi:hypothetical protein